MRPTFDEIVEARGRLDGAVTVTPGNPSLVLSSKFGCEVYDMLEYPHECGFWLVNFGAAQ
jgi:hypothetical protein